MNDIRIFKVTIDHFRGFCEPQSFTLESGSDFVLLAGFNGFGKTSFYDAIEWGFTGELFRYSEPNEDKKKSPIITHQPFEKPAKVTIEFGNDQSTYTLVRRVKTYDGSSDYGVKKTSLTLTGPENLKLQDQRAVDFLNDLMIKDEWKGKVEFRKIFPLFHMLTQDKLKHFVQGLKGPQRYEELSALIGTEDYSQFKTKVKKVKDQACEQKTTLETKVDKLNNEINTLQMLIDSHQEINVGKEGKLDEFLSSLLSDFNSIRAKLKLEPMHFSSDDLAQNVSTFSNQILAVKAIISSKMTHNDKAEETLESLQVEKDQYQANQLKVKQLKQLIPLQKQYENLSYILNNLSAYQMYFSEKSKMQKEKALLVADQQHLGDYKIRVENLIEQLRKQHQQLEDYQGADHILEKRINIILRNLAENNVDLLIDDQNIILSQNQMSLSSFTYPLGREMESCQTLNDLYQEALMDFTEKIKVIYQQIEGQETNKVILKDKIQSLETEIRSLSELEDNLKVILTDSLNYIKANTVKDDVQVQCPVCHTGFESSNLVKTIEERISQSSPLITEKMNHLKLLEEKLVEVNKRLSLNQDQFQIQFEKLEETFDVLKNDLSLLVRGLAESEREKAFVLVQIENKLEKMEKENEKIVSLIKREGIMVEQEKMNQEITVRMDGVKDRIMELGYTVEHLDVDDQKELDRLDKELIIFEKKLVKHEIDKEKISESIEGYLQEVRLVSQELEKVQAQLSYIESKVLETKKMVTNNENVEKLTKLRITLNEHKREIHKLEFAIKQLEQVQDSVMEVVQEMNEKIIAEQENFIKTIYQRINPHPYFRDIKLSVDQNRHSSRTLGISCGSEEDGENAVDPAFTFSSAQTNIVAISIFFALALRQQCTNLNTILLDDPVQSMDDINIIAFIDVLRSFVGEGMISKLNKQIIISTHDDKIFRLMSKKFRFLNVVSFKFVDYNSRGPKLEVLPAN